MGLLSAGTAVYVTMSDNVLKYTPRQFQVMQSLCLVLGPQNFGHSAVPMDGASSWLHSFDGAGWHHLFYEREEATGPGSTAPGTQSSCRGVACRLSRLG